MKKFIKSVLIFALVFVLSLSTSAVCLAKSSEKSKVKLNKTKLTLYVGDTYNLKISGTKQKVTWTSSNKKVATVNKKGCVKTVGKGKATITVKVSGKKYTCAVNVKEITSLTVFTNGTLLTSVNELKISVKEIKKLSNGAYMVNAYIYNGYSGPVSNININRLKLYDKYGSLVASAAFGECQGLVLNGNSYAEWAFIFPKKCVFEGNFDLMENTIEFDYSCINHNPIF